MTHVEVRLIGIGLTERPLEDVDDPDEVSQCVSIDIPVEGSPDAASAAVHPEALVDLEGKMAALLAAHASETRKLEERVAQLEQLDLAVQITSAARDCASAAKAATELLSGATEAVRILRDDDQIESLIASHCENAAHAIATADRLLSPLARGDVASLETSAGSTRG